VTQNNGEIVMEISGKNQHVDLAVEVAVEVTVDRDLDRHPVVAKLIKKNHVLVGLTLVIVKVNTKSLCHKIVPNHVVVNEDKL